MKYIILLRNLMFVSFESPEYTANADALGALRILEAIRRINLEKKLNFIKRELQNYMVCQKFLRMKNSFHLATLMLQNLCHWINQL